MNPHKAKRSALALIAAHNVVQNTILNRRGYVTSNLVVATALVGFGKTSGLTFSEMGLSLRLKRDDLRLAGIAAGVTTAASLIALVHPKSREVLRDKRAHDSTGDVIAYKALIRFPFGTALFEEITFRGVLPALAVRSDPAGDLVSAGLFGMWHIIPTARALPASPLSTEMTLGQRIKAVLAGSAVTGLTGLVFSWLRRRSGSVALPWLTHSAFNTITYLAGVIAWRLGDYRSRRSTPPPK